MTTVKLSFLLLASIFAVQTTKAQTDSKTYAFNDFDSVQIESIYGEVNITLGKSFHIAVSGKDKAAEQVVVTQTNGMLVLKLASQFEKNWKSRKPVRILLEMPEMSKLYNSSNADVRIQSCVGRYLGIENSGNGNVTLTGTTLDFLELKNEGNGDVESNNLSSKKVVIFKAGNGDIRVRTDNNFSVSMRGNGDIINYGKGRAIVEQQSGNGRVVYRN